MVLHLINEAEDDFIIPIREDKYIFNSIENKCIMNNMNTNNMTMIKKEKEILKWKFHTDNDINYNFNSFIN